MRILLTTIFAWCILSAGSVMAHPSLSAAEASCGRLTEVKGTVYRRGFADDTKEVWAKPVAAHVGDTVSDGMQIGTGNDSWTQCSFNHFTARAWENSVYMVSPNQKLVYLVGGELLFNLDKNRKDKAPYSVWTKYLHARVRGTTILVQTTEDGSKISVLEGTIDVTNRIDNSVVTLTPGVVYEVKSKHSGKEGATTGDAQLNKSSNPVDSAIIGSQHHQDLENAALTKTAQAYSGLIDLATTELTDLSVAGINPVVLFDSVLNTTFATLTSLDQVLLHPLLTSFDSPLSSLPLIKDEMPLLKSDSLSPLESTTSIFKSLNVQQVPVLTAYSIGSDALKEIKAGEIAFKHWPPNGVVSWSKEAVNTALPIAGLPGGVGKIGGVAGGVNPVLNSVLNRGVLSPVQGLTVNTLSNVTRAGRLVGGLVGVGSTSVSRGGGGVIGGLGGAVGGAVGGLGGAAGGLGGALGGGLGGALGGGLGGLLK